MTASSTQELIVSAAGDYGTALLAILGAIIGIGIGYLVFRVGLRKLRGIVR